MSLSGMVMKAAQVCVLGCFRGWGPVWSSIAVAHDDTCAIWKRNKPLKWRARLLSVSVNARGICCCFKESFLAPDGRFSRCTVERKGRQKRDRFKIFKSLKKNSPRRYAAAMSSSLCCDEKWWMEENCCLFSCSCAYFLTSQMEITLKMVQTNSLTALPHLQYPDSAFFSLMKYHIKGNNWSICSVVAVGPEIFQLQLLIL